jgi:hypothetical protein
MNILHDAKKFNYNLMAKRRDEKIFMADRPQPRNPLFSENLREAVFLRFRFQHEFARQVGCTDAEASLMLHQGMVPMPPRLLKIEQVLGVSRELLLTDHGERRREVFLREMLVSLTQGMADAHRLLLVRAASVLASGAGDLVETLEHVIALCERLFHGPRSGR